VAPDGWVYALNPGSQYVDADIQGGSGQGEITVVPSRRNTRGDLAGDSLYARQRSRVIAAVNLARTRAAAERERRLALLRTRMLGLIAKAPPNLRAYYKGMLERLNVNR
jgi:hypothetical protein